MKKIIMVFMTLTLIVSTGLMGGTTLEAARKEIVAYLDGEKLSFVTSPVMEQGTTLVPFRTIFEALDIEVKWNPKTQKVTGQKEGLSIELTIGSKTAYVNNQKVALPVAPKIKNGNTLVPLRFVGESSGVYVLWNGAEQEIYLASDPKVALDAASYVNDLNTVKAIFEKYQYDGNVKIADGNNEYPLLFNALFYGSVDIVKYLLSKGADPNYLYVEQDEDGEYFEYVPLNFALDYPEITKMLIEAGADVNFNSYEHTNSSILHVASYDFYSDGYGTPEAALLLLQAGAKVDVMDENGYTPLYYALDNYLDETVRHLLNYGASMSLVEEVADERMLLIIENYKSTKKTKGIPTSDRNFTIDWHIDVDTIIDDKNDLFEEGEQNEDYYYISYTYELPDRTSADLSYIFSYEQDDLAAMILSKVGVKTHLEAQQFMKEQFLLLEQAYGENGSTLLIHWNDSSIEAKYDALDNDRDRAFLLTQSTKEGNAELEYYFRSGDSHIWLTASNTGTFDKPNYDLAVHYESIF